MGHRSRRRTRNAILGALLLIAAIAMPTWGQGLELAPSNPLGMPGTTGGLPQGSNSLHLNSGMFRGLIPLISNLEFGYIYNFGDRVSTGRLSVDYVAPLGLGPNGSAFGEVHGEFTNFWKTFQRFIRSVTTVTTETPMYDRIDLSFGGGYRRLFNERLLVGFNAFYDASQLGGGTWYGSGGVGLEMISLLPGGDALDLNFNYYGDLFQGRNSIVNAFRNGAGNYDVEMGYSHELGEGGPDLRLKLTGYQFDVGTKIYGWDAGAEVTTRNGVFRVKAEAGRDEINGEYYTIGGFVNIGIQLSNLATGESPFTAPEPIFKSPRNLRRLLTRKVKRGYSQAASVVVARSTELPSGPGGCGTITYTGTGGPLIDLVAGGYHGVALPVPANFWQSLNAAGPCSTLYVTVNLTIATNSPQNIYVGIGDGVWPAGTTWIWVNPGFPAWVTLPNTGGAPQAWSGGPWGHATAQSTFIANNVDPSFVLIYSNPGGIPGDRIVGGWTATVHFNAP